ncbi:putative glycosyl transferase domain protein, partial [Yersinia pestis PY-01]|jgi:hypothetical protein
MANV